MDAKSTRGVRGSRLDRRSGPGEPSHSVVGTAADVAMWLQAVMFSGLWDPAVVRERV